MKVVAAPRFWAWRRSLDASLKPAVDALVGWLAVNGTALYSHRQDEDVSRWEPEAKRIESSSHWPDLWELRDDRTIGGVHLRLLVGFVDVDRVVALVGGDKTGNWSEWYQVAVPTADRALDHLRRGQK